MLKNDYGYHGRRIYVLAVLIDPRDGSIRGISLDQWAPKTSRDDAVNPDQFYDWIQGVLTPFQNKLRKEEKALAKQNKANKM